MDFSLRDVIGGFDELFDLDGDEKLNEVERALEMDFIMHDEPDEDEEETDDFTCDEDEEEDVPF